MYEGFRKSSDSVVPEIVSTDSESIVKFVKRLLKKSLYENSDFEVTKEYISIELRYNSKSYVSFYQKQIANKYPNNTKVIGNRITVYFEEK